MIRYSILDLAPIAQGSDASQSFRNSLDLARRAERWGYYRYWLAEHHNIPGVASAATGVVAGYIASGTKSIRVGSGGIMLPNHAPLVIAEQFGTLESMYPGRIDLGIGRAPGGDPTTARALRRALGIGADTFPADVLELQNYFTTPSAGQSVKAIPGSGLQVPLYLLGSSDFSARLAAEMGLPFAFASHFAPDYLHSAIELYRKNFRPSEQLEEPYVMIGVNVIAADTDEEAQRLFTSLQQLFLNLLRGHPQEVPPPVESMEGRWNPMEEARARQMTRCSAVGSPETVRRQLDELIAETNADEIIATAQIYDHTARLESFEIAAHIFSEIIASEQSTLAEAV